MTTRPATPIKLFYSYADSRKDEKLLDELEKHLSSLKHQGYISAWNKRKVVAGKEWEKEIDKHFNAARIILLLISPDFMASDYCYGFEVKRAMERHDRGEARVIPILLRPVDWHNTPFSKLQPLPGNGKPISKWRDMDEALNHVAQEIRRAIESLPTENPVVISSPEVKTEQHPPSVVTTNEKIQGLERPATAFFSYAMEDAEGVERLQLQLQVRGVRVWPDAKKPEEHYRDDKIVDSIKKADTFILCVTPGSLASARIWDIEVPTALERQKLDQDFKIIPVFRNVMLDELRLFCAAHGYDFLERAFLADKATGRKDLPTDRYFAQRSLEAALSGRIHRIGADHNRLYEPTLCLRTYTYEPPTNSLDLDLDWTEFFPSKDELPTEEVCEVILLAALDDVKKILSGKKLSNRLHIYLKAHIPAALAFGASIPAVSGFKLFIDAYVEGQSQTWSTAENAPTLEPLQRTILEQKGADHVAVMEIGIPATVASDVERNLPLLGISCKQDIRFELVDGSKKVKDSAHAFAISFQVGQELRRLYGQEGITHIHHFAAVPAALAVLIGHQINAMSAITLYHFMEKDRRYVAVCTIGKQKDTK